jgi:predicted DNA-binding protein
MNKKPKLYPVKIEFRVTKEMREKLNVHARKEGKVVADLMRNAVNSILETKIYGPHAKDYAAYSSAFNSIQKDIEYVKSLVIAK